MAHPEVGGQSLQFMRPALKLAMRHNSTFFLKKKRNCANNKKVKVCPVTTGQILPHRKVQPTNSILKSSLVAADLRIAGQTTRFGKTSNGKGGVDEQARRKVR
jgi:hypothetical protein